MLTKLILKHGDKVIYPICAFIVIALAAILITIFVNTGEKTPATCEQVNSALVNLGYNSADSTDYYIKQNSKLKSSVAGNNGNVSFYFFEFDDNDSDSALLTFENIQTQINKKRELGYHDWDEHYNNYAMYSMSSNGIYYMTIWVGNTAIYAYCDEEHTGELGEILTAIGYQS